MRKIIRVFSAQTDVEDSSVSLKNGFSNADTEYFNPFRCFDIFSNMESSSYRLNFLSQQPGEIKTIVYVLHGESASNEKSSPLRQEIKSDDVPCVNAEHISVRVVGGEYNEIQGFVDYSEISLIYLDVTLDPLTPFSLHTELSKNFFVYVVKGRLMVRDDRSELWVGEGGVGLLSHDSQFSCVSGKEGTRFFLIGGNSVKQ